MFRTLPPFGGDQRQVSEVVRGLMDGKSNNTELLKKYPEAAASTIGVSTLKLSMILSLF